MGRGTELKICLHISVKVTRCAEGDWLFFTDSMGAEKILSAKRAVNIGGSCLYFAE